jgi:hypothetical protein
MTKKLGKSFWWLWLFANIGGSTILPLLVWQDPYDLRSRILLNEILQGIGIALAQSTVLKERLAQQPWWVPLTLCGWFSGLGLIYFVPVLSWRRTSGLPPLQILLLDFALMGAIIGICQWQLLRRFRAGGLWLFASTLGFAASAWGMYWGYALQSRFNQSPWLATAIATVLQGAIYGAVTGVAAFKILRSPKIIKPKSNPKSK